MKYESRFVWFFIFTVGGWLGFMVGRMSAVSSISMPSPSTQVVTNDPAILEIKFEGLQRQLDLHEKRLNKHSDTLYPPAPRPQ